MIAPFFQELSEKYPGIVFLKVDVDQCEVRMLSLIGVSNAATFLDSGVGQLTRALSAWK